MSLAALGVLDRLTPTSAAQERPVNGSQPVVRRSPAVEAAVYHDVSLPLYLIAPAARQAGQRAHPAKPIPRHISAANGAAVDSVAQESAPTVLAPAPILNFNGVGNGFTGPAGTFSVASAPPDTNGDVGPNDYVQIVNTDFAIFNKSGTAIFGPVAINTLWSGFGGGCETNNDGDPVVLYDSIANRWVISQFSVSTTPYLQCVAVSQTGDPTSSYNRYSFQYTDFPDYPKMGVWPDAYYQTFNMFAGGTTFSGGTVCAYDRTSMLAGLPATQQCFSVGTNYGGLLPASLDGARQPPAGSPNYVLSLGVSNNDLAFWKFHVDWTNTSNTTLTGPTTLTVGTYSEACGGGTCIPQAGTSQQLDSLADRLMFRLAYRNFGDHEALVTNHSVVAGSSVGVCWYEIRTPGTTPTVFQQGTYAPDSDYRWMGSIAMDQSGDMALGFSASGSAIHPEIRYSGRLAGDPAGQMSQGEATFIVGGGSQSGSFGLTRWGDYSRMAVDPSDDCTFWYTNEYIPSDGEFNWKTEIAAFKFASCGPAANDFSISASPNSVSVQQGASGHSTISTAVTSGSAQTVNLAVSGVPSGASASLSPTSVTAGGSSTLTMNAGTAAAGTYTLTVTGTEGSNMHSALVKLTVTTAPPMVVSLTPSSGTGVTKTFSAVVSDPAGLADLKTLRLLFNTTSANQTSACSVYYWVGSNHLYIYNDAGTTLSAPVTPGSATTVSNSQCTLAGTGSSISKSGNNLTVNVALTFTAAFTGLKNAYIYASGNDGLNTSWVKKGTWTPGAPQPPTVVSLTPNAGSGAIQTFSAVVSDPAGLADLKTLRLLFNTTSANQTSACSVYYWVGSNHLYIYNDAGTTLSAPVTPGSATTVSNSQCTLAGTGSSISKSGNNLTVNVALTFTAAFTGLKNVYVYASGNDGLNTGWVKKGTWAP